MTGSIYTATGQSTPRCSCRGEIPDLTFSLDQNQPALDEVLKAIGQSIDFWPRLKGCQACLKTRLEELLVTYGRLVDACQTKADLFRSTSRSAVIPPKADKSEPAGHSLGSSNPTNRSNSSMPPVFLGDLRLDNQQSATALWVILHSDLKQLASILYEMRRVDCGLETRLEGHIGDLLYKVLNLMEPTG